MRPSPKPRKALPPPRVRHEPPTIEEAVSAARDLTTDVELQTQIAAGLMGVAAEEVRPVVLKAQVQRASAGQERIVATAAGTARRVVVVERRPLRARTASR